MNLVPTKVMKLKEEDHEELKAEVLKKRVYVTQANIVRVMKKEKQCEFNHLTAEVKRNITLFELDMKMVKEQIEVLIRDEYMKRDENKRTLLIYLP